MPILYESYAKLQPNDVVTVFFETREPFESILIKSRLLQYNWIAKGLELRSLRINKKGGSVTFRVLPSFIEPLTMLAIATVVASATGLITTIVKMWTIAQITNPLLAPGPLGFPMIFWLIIASAGVLIPLAITLKRR